MMPKSKPLWLHQKFIGICKDCHIAVQAQIKPQIPYFISTYHNSWYTVRFTEQIKTFTTCIWYILWRKANVAKAAGGQLSSTSCQSRLTISSRSEGAELFPPSHSFIYAYFSTKSALSSHMSILLYFPIYIWVLPASVSFSKLSNFTFSWLLLWLPPFLHLHQSLPLFLVNSHDNIPLKDEGKFVNGLVIKVWMCFWQRAESADSRFMVKCD